MNRSSSIMVPEWMVNTGNALLEYHYAGVF